MKKIIALLLLTLMFACEKDKPEPIQSKYTERDVFNALIGTWKPSRLSYDVNFSKTFPVKEDDSWFGHRVTFKADSIMITKFDSIASERQGRFTVEIGGPNRADTAKLIRFDEKLGIRGVPTREQRGGGIHLDHFTDSTIVFSKQGSSGDFFSEFKRVK